MNLFDLQSATQSASTHTADAGTADKDAVQPGTAEGKPGDSPFTVEEWAEQMAPVLS